MRKNGLEADAFAISRIPIPSPLCMKREADRRYVARRREPPAQVRPLHRPAEAVAVAVAEPVDGVDAREQKDIKTGVLPSTVPKPCVADVEAGWPLDANANAPRPDVDPPLNDEEVKWGVSGPVCLLGFSKPGMGSPKPLGIIKPSVPLLLPTNAHESGNLANGNVMWGNRLIVPSCEKIV